MEPASWTGNPWDFFLFRFPRWRPRDGWKMLEDIWMCPKIVGFPPKSSILIGFSIINHPFWGISIFGNTHICRKTNGYPTIPGKTLIVWKMQIFPFFFQETC